MNGLKSKLKTIWFAANGVGALVFAVMIPLMFEAGAETLPVFILSAIAGVVARYGALFALVPLFAPELSRLVKDTRIERVGEDIEVASSVESAGDPELDGYVKSYAEAHDYTSKTLILLLVAIILVIAITVIHGPILF